MSQFRHEALFYDSDEDFLKGTVPFVREAVANEAAVMVALNSRKLDLLKSRLNGEASAVTFADMGEIGRNPNLIIPAWREFIDGNSDNGRPLRGIGEPIWAERSAEEQTECRHHEALLNVAFADSPDLWIMCPYDSTSLSPDVLEHAERTHPILSRSGGTRQSNQYALPSLESLDSPLSEPADPIEALAFDAESLSFVRVFVETRALMAGLGWERAESLLIAANELATNSIRHGGGGGTISIWLEESALVTQVRDRGYITNPLIGRVQPKLDQTGGFGLWLVNNLCDLVQLRSSPAGTTIRVHMSLRQA